MMELNVNHFLVSILIFVLPALDSSAEVSARDSTYLCYVVNTSELCIGMYWKDDSGRSFQSFHNLLGFLGQKKREVLFATNGGMYTPDGDPVGLFIQDHRILVGLNTDSGSGNFYLRPNGVFYIKADGIAGILPTTDFSINSDIRSATQSGPMLVQHGQINPIFDSKSSSRFIRNGVGILSDDRVIFVMSKTEVTFHEFASKFVSLGCKQALYLDGFVSRTYLPDQHWLQTDGHFAVIIAVTKPKNDRTRDCGIDP